MYLVLLVVLPATNNISAAHVLHYNVWEWKTATVSYRAALSSVSSRAAFAVCKAVTRSYKAQPTASH